MSAPPLVNPPAMPTAVSRLPKFCSRPKSASTSNGAQSGPSAPVNPVRTSTRLTNGSSHPPGPAGVNAPPPSVKQNGFIRVPSSFSLRWRKENVAMEDGGAEGERGWRRGKGGNVGNRSGNDIPQCNSQRQQVSPAASLRESKQSTTSSVGKGRAGRAATSPSSPSPQSRPRTLPLPRASPSGTKQLPSGLAKPWSGPNGLRRPQGFAQAGGSRPGSGPGHRSDPPLQQKAAASRSQSTDSLGTAASAQLTQSDRFRSRSLTQVGQQPSPSLPPSSSSSSQTVPRSYINRAPGLKDPSAPVRSSMGAGVKGQRSTASLLPPSGLKKPLLPSLAAASKPSGISYKQSRFTFIKLSRPLRVTAANGPGGDDEAAAPPAAGHGSEAPETGGLPAEPVSPMSFVEDTLVDMSLSPAWSLERNDTSQECMDDFDNLGNGGVGLPLPSKNDEEDSGLDQSCARLDDKLSVNGVSKTPGLCFVDDWAGVRLGERDAHHLTRLSCQRRSSQPDYHEQGGSSLDLSPSDSCGSGGTYMWDEEDLEPLGGAATTASINTNSNTSHHIGSFDSDLNSIDILNNLDSCDLEDDNLMLDTDLGEDASLASDGDGTCHMAEWRRRQLCWGMKDLHNDNDGDFQCFQLTEDPGNKRTETTRDADLILDLCPSGSPCLSPASPGPGLDVEELAEDCSAVRSQLEFLQRLLVQEDDVDNVDDDPLSPEADDSSDSQVQTLLQEVQRLREELRSRDRTIAQLTLKLAVPTATTSCYCQETTGKMDQHTQTIVTERESVASQTPWRDHASQILHSSSQDEQEPLTDQVPTPSPASGHPRFTQPEVPADGPPDRPHSCITSPLTHGEEDGRLEGRSETKERRGTYNRSLPLPSKLRLFLSQTSRPGSNSAPAPPSKTRTSHQLSNDSESSGSSGLKLKAPGSNSSRLPKPKTY